MVTVISLSIKEIRKREKEQRRDYILDEAEKLFFKSAEYLKSECNRLGIELFGIGKFLGNAFSKHRNSAFFTVENGKALNGKIENVSYEKNILSISICFPLYNDKKLL